MEIAFTVWLKQAGYDLMCLPNEYDMKDLRAAYDRDEDPENHVLPSGDPE